MLSQYSSFSNHHHFPSFSSFISCAWLCISPSLLYFLLSVLIFIMPFSFLYFFLSSSISSIYFSTVYLIILEIGPPSSHRQRQSPTAASRKCSCKIQLFFALSVLFCYLILFNFCLLAHYFYLIFIIFFLSRYLCSVQPLTLFKAISIYFLLYSDSFKFSISYLISFYLIISHYILLFLIIFYLILPNFILLYLILFYLIISYLALSYILDEL